MTSTSGADPSNLQSNAEVEALRRKNADLLANAAEASLLMDDLVASLEPQEKENAELKDLVDGLMQDLERVTTELEDLKSRSESPPLASSSRRADWLLVVAARTFSFPRLDSSRRLSDPKHLGERSVVWTCSQRPLRQVERIRRFNRHERSRPRFR